MAKALAGAKKGKKKWSKGSTRDEIKNAVMFDKATLDKLNNEVPKYKVITPQVVSDRLKIAVSVAAAGLRHLASKKVIKVVCTSSKWRVYSRVLSQTE